MQYAKTCRRLLRCLKLKLLFGKSYPYPPTKSHHLLDGVPAYPQRFLKVLKFHAPGYAPAQDESGAFHIDVAGNSIYSEKVCEDFWIL